jgi:hypothetical protein
VTVAACALWVTDQLGDRLVRIDRPLVGAAGTLWFEALTGAVRREDHRQAIAPNNLIRVTRAVPAREVAPVAHVPAVHARQSARVEAP